jgi:flagellar basal-body rod protein FlgB
MKVFSYNPSNKYLESALNSRTLRQDLIASNIANVDTPYYRSKDIDFETELAKAAHEEFENKTISTPTLQLAKTDKNHLDPIDFEKELNPTLFYRDGHLARNDGNTVDLDVETTELAKNNTMYNAITAALKKNKLMFLAAVESSRQL